MSYYVDQFGAYANWTAFRTMQYLSNMVVEPKPNNEDKKELLAVSFNQDCSALAVGHDEGYALYLLKSVENLEKIYEATTPRRTCIIERLFSSSLLTFVSMQHTRKLNVYHYQKDNEICNHSYSSAILAVKLNRKRVIVCLEESIHVHNIRDMRLLHVIKDTPPNPLGLVDLSPNEESCYLAYPGSATTGHVQIFDADTLTATCGFAAHDGILAQIKFSPDSKKVATASDKGTVIRVFEVPSGARLFEFTRGMKRCVTIYSLAFSQDSMFLASSSNTETIHVFSLIRPDPAVEQQKQEQAEESGVSSWYNFISQQASAYLPSHMNDLMLREKSICTAHLPMSGVKTVVGIPKINGTNYLVVASADGYLFYYTIESDGQECSLIRQFRIGPSYGEEQPGQIVPIGSNTVRAGSTRADTGQLYPHTSEQRRPSPSGSDGSDTSRSSGPKVPPPAPVKRESPLSSSSSSPPERPKPPSFGSNSPSPAPRSGASNEKTPPKERHESDNNSIESQEDSEESDNALQDLRSGLESPPCGDDLDEFPPLKADFLS